MIDTKLLLEDLEQVVQMYAECVPPGATDGHPDDDLYYGILQSAQQLIRHHDDMSKLGKITVVTKIIYLSAVAFNRLNAGRLRSDKDVIAPSE